MAEFAKEPPAMSKPHKDIDQLIVHQGETQRSQKPVYTGCYPKNKAIFTKSTIFKKLQMKEESETSILRHQSKNDFHSATENVFTL